MIPAIEHNERIGEDWRAAFRSMVDENVLQLRQDRHAQIRRRIYLGMSTLVVKDMTDVQIDLVSRRLAEKDCERGIIEQRQAELRQKSRFGCAT